MQKKKNHKGGKPLSLRERSIIEVRWCRDYKSITDIAKELKRNKSSISREVGAKPRKGVGKYNADVAHGKALIRISNRGNIPKTAKNDWLKSYIETKLKDERWSPEQVSIRLPHEFPKDETMRIAPESVYQEVYRRVHRRGNGTVRKGELDLRPYLPRRHKRRAKKGFRKAQKSEREDSLPSIDTRPEVVSRRARVGDWEDDTLVSRQSKARIKNVTERKSGVTFFGKTKDGTAKSCDEMLTKVLSPLPQTVLKTLTRDRGTENLEWQKIEQGLGFKVGIRSPNRGFLNHPS